MDEAQPVEAFGVAEEPVRAVGHEDVVMRGAHAGEDVDVLGVAEEGHRSEVVNRVDRVGASRDPAVVVTATDVTLDVGGKVGAGTRPSGRRRSPRRSRSRAPWPSAAAPTSVRREPDALDLGCRIGPGRAVAG